jgi:hypothetical protein
MTWPITGMSAQACHPALFVQMINIQRKCTLTTSMSPDSLQISQCPLQLITTNCSKTIKWKKIMCVGVIERLHQHLSTMPWKSKVGQGKVQHSALQFHSSHISPAYMAAELSPGLYNPTHAWPQHWLPCLSGHHSCFTTGWSQVQISDQKWVTPIFTTLLSLCEQMPVKQLKSHYDHFLTNPFQLTIHLVTITKFEIPTALLTRSIK